VSPKKVVVAGRVSALGAVVVDDDEEGWAAGAFVAVDVPEEAGCALAAAAVASSSSDARETRRTMVCRLQSPLPLLLLAAAVRLRRGHRFGLLLGNYEAAPAAAADLASFSTGRPCFVSRPFVRRPLFMRRAAAFAGNLTLLFGRHRREPSPFFSFGCIHYSPPLGHHGRTPQRYQSPCHARRI
jgi:hypothetical protein